MFSNSYAAFEIHESLARTAASIDARDAAERIAAGTMRVERDANPNRRFGVTFAHLGKLNPIEAMHVNDLIACFSILNARSDCLTPTILGLAESGIVPAFAMQQACVSQGRNSRWFCTSRRPSKGWQFKETHSHAPNHYLPTEMFDQPIQELWVIEDEITTGRTLLNLLDLLREHRRVQRVRVFSLLDTRHCEESQEDTPSLEEHATISSILLAGSDFWTLPMSRQPMTAIRSFENSGAIEKLAVGESIAHLLPGLLSGQFARLQQITLSPWKIDAQNVFSRQQWAPGFYRYNAEHYAGFCL